MCDNMAVVEVLSFGRAKDPIMAACARYIWLLAAMYNINIVVSHIRGLDNTVADLLSRWHQTSDNPVWVNAPLDLTFLNHDIQPGLFGFSDSQVATATQAYRRLWVWLPTSHLQFIPENVPSVHGLPGDGGSVAPWSLFIRYTGFYGIPGTIRYVS